MPLSADVAAVTTNGSSEEPKLQDSALTANPPSGQSIEYPGQSFKSVPWNDLSILYLIKNSTHGLYKLGYSDDVQRRLNDLQRESAYALELVAEWRCPKVCVRAFESLLHDKLSYCRTHGEWFAIDDETLAEIEQLDTWVVPMVRKRRMC